MWKGITQNIHVLILHNKRTLCLVLSENDLTAEECVVMAIAKAQAASDRPLSKADMRRIRNTEVRWPVT